MIFINHVNIVIQMHNFLQKKKSPIYSMGLYLTTFWGSGGGCVCTSDFGSRARVIGLLDPDSTQKVRF